MSSARGLAVNSRRGTAAAGCPSARRATGARLALSAKHQLCRMCFQWDVLGQNQRAVKYLTACKAVKPAFS